VTSSPVSRLDSVLLKIFLGLVVLRPLEHAIPFRTAVGQPVSGGLLLGLAAFGLFARCAQIDDVAHVKLGDNQVLLHGPRWPYLVWNDCGARWHWNTAI
jgi:hypothetical protein